MLDSEYYQKRSDIGLELYIGDITNRYGTFTGNTINSLPIADCTQAVLTTLDEVIGQEFDYVLVVIDNNFRYDANGDLTAREHPNPEYLFPRLFYQNISRAREKLCIVVLNNQELFKKLLCIKCGE